MSESEDAENLDKLVQHKLPLVQADYESYFEAWSRAQALINQLHTWQVTILVALLAFASKVETTTFEAILPVFFLNVAFAILEASRQARITVINRDALVAESKLQKTNLFEFCTNIVNWQFGNTVASRHRFPEYLRMTFQELLYPPLLLWHGSLTLVVLFFAWLIR
jgi:hypothetical protein